MERRRNKNQICHFREKCAFASNALFSRKYRFYFRSETEKRTSGASGTASGGRTPARRAGGEWPRQAEQCRERAERAEGGGRRPKGDDRAKGERAERASIYRPSAVDSNSAVEKCSLFVVSSLLLGGSMHPISEDTEKRRNGT